jgi:cytochrome P450
MPVEELLPLVNELIELTVTASSPLHTAAERLRVRRLLRYANAFETVVEMLAGHLADRRREGAEGDDLLALLVRTADTEPISERDLALEAFGHLFSLPDSTVNLAAWVFYLLWRHPDACARVLAENEDPDAAYDALPYTGAVLHEALRLYPPSWINSRRALEDLELGGRRVKKGENVAVLLYLVHRDPRHWPEPERFDPDRFAAELERARPRTAFVPFGAGLRRCIGRDFAWAETTLVLAVLAQRWRLRPLVEAVRLLPQFTLRPRGGIPVRLERRPDV